MSAEDEGKTESATGRRLDKAYEEGEVPLGKDAMTVGNLAFALAGLSAAAIPLRNALTELLRDRFTAVADVAHGPANESSGLFYQVTALGIGACAAAAAGAILVGIIQTRGGFWIEKIAPDLSRLFSNKLAALFSKKLFTDIGVALLKVVVIGAAVSGVWRDKFMALPALMTAAPGSLLGTGASWLWPVLVRALTAAGVLAGLDLALQHWRFRERLKMSRDEVKREGKEENGDPMIKGKRRRKMRDLMRGRVAVEVPRADALLVNPTHIAIAIRYRRDEGAAPRVIAKGKGKLAEVMRELARENGIPIVEDIPLARMLYKRVKVGRSVPAETFKAVAAILAFVYRLTGKRPGGTAKAA
jgi:flagellar biosynthesis protein FlhB